MHDCKQYKVGRQESTDAISVTEKIPVRVAAGPQSSQEANGFRAATIAVGRHDESQLRVLSCKNGQSAHD